MVHEPPEGGFAAEALGHSIYTGGDTLAELREMVRDAVLCHFDDDIRAKIIRLHFVREEVIVARNCRESLRDTRQNAGCPQTPYAPCRRNKPYKRSRKINFEKKTSRSIFQPRIRNKNASDIKAESVGRQSSAWSVRNVRR
jgi:hypothetical protein